MLNDLGYPGENLVQDICNGFKLSGWLQKSGVFPPAFKRPVHDMDTAKKLAKGVNHGICKQVAEPSDDTLSQEVWKQTQEELEKGWTWMDGQSLRPKNKTAGEKIWFAARRESTPYR
jgi:hypothetical protein